MTDGDDELSARLAALAARREAADPALARTYQRMIDRLAEADRAAPAAGGLMPGFLLPDDRGRLTSLDGLLRDGPLVVSLNRGHWCPYCHLELASFAALAPAIAERGGSVVSITPERQPFAGRMRAQSGIEFPILIDIDNAYALSLGLMFWVGDAVRDHYRDSGVDLTLFQGNDGWFLPIPATFVVGTDGRVLARHVDADFRRRMPGREVLAALDKALSEAGRRSGEAS